MDYLNNAAAILRDQRLAELLATIAEWRETRGFQHTEARRDAILLLRQWKRRYTIPERAAFELAVARSKQGSKR
jgi:hypothetical protein